MKTSWVRASVLCLLVLWAGVSRAGEAGLAERAEAILQAGDYEKAIGLLEGPAAENPNDFPINIAYSLALLEKCEALKARGDRSYGKLVYTPYRIGGRLVRINQTRPEPYHVVGWALLINERPYKGLRWLKKAIHYDRTNAVYWALFGDGCVAYAEQEKKHPRGSQTGASTNVRRFYREAEKAYRQALEYAGDDPDLRDEVNAKLEALP